MGFLDVKFLAYMEKLQVLGLQTKGKNSTSICLSCVPVFSGSSSKRGASIPLLAGQSSYCLI